VDDGLVIARLIHFAAAMAAFGGAAFRLYAIERDAGRARADALTSLDRWSVNLVRASALLMFISALAIVPFVAAGMAGAASAAFDPTTLATVLFATEFGRVWCWHLLFAALLIVGTAVAPHRPALNVICAALALASLGWVGHAAGGSGWAGFGREINQSVHLLAAGLWLGGSLPLGWLLGRARRASDGFDRLLRYALPAFSQMGYVAVTVIAVTGAVNTLVLVGSFEALFSTDYGRLLSLKIVLYLAMVAIALRNRLQLMPRLSDGDTAAAGALYRSVLLEQAIGFGILAVVSILGTWPPPFMHHH
jgi:putative copper resistance protein D